MHFSTTTWIDVTGSWLSVLRMTLIASVLSQNRRARLDDAWVYLVAIFLVGLGLALLILRR